MHTQHHALLEATPGTRRELVSHHYGTPGRGPKVYIQASLHADELPGMLVAHYLKREFDGLAAAGRIAGEIVLVPMANPIGLSQRLLHAHLGRFELASGENFNRHYPEAFAAAGDAAAARLGADAQANVAVLRAALREAVAATPAETELQSLRRTLMGLACDADVVLDLHCDAQAVLHLYTETPCWPQCEPLAQWLGARVTLLAQDSGDSPFDEACSQVWRHWAARFGAAHPVPQACLAVTVELRGSADVDHHDARRDARNIVHYLMERGAVAGTPPARPEPIGDARPLAGSMPVAAPVGGLLVFLREPGAEVHAGEAIAEVIDPLTQAVTPLASPVDGLLYARETLRFVSRGQRIAKVAGRDARRTGKLLGA
ncbi:MAG: succinylglutamate desuccinylase/aspartoacylase family protein [Pelomonas sp.]|nr:succinylglutamate desuccinylase/aspartoacylase family protein [Roseateles sp.]